MKPRQVLPYIAGLFLLAWALGSLARSGSGGGSLLLNSYWLVYIVEFLPLIALSIMVVMVVYLALSWKVLSDALGFGLAKKRSRRKRSRTAQVLVWVAAWTFALAFLMFRCGGIFCTNTGENTLKNALKDQVAGQAPPLALPQLGGALTSITGFMGTSWFAAAFFGLLIVCSAVIVRSLKVAMDVTGEETAALQLMAQEQGQRAVRDALKVLDEYGYADPRTRILASYQRMIRAASDLGAPVGLNQTARELEAGIRTMFMLKGPGIRELTQLFEEARYSLHTITEEDSEKAHGCLLEIAEELRVVASVQA